MSGEGDPTPPPATTSGATFTQEQVDRIAGGARTEAVSKFFKDAGIDTMTPEQVKALIDASNESENSKKDAVERLTGEVNKYKADAEKLPTKDRIILQQQTAATLGLPVRFWKFVEGEDQAAIEESVKGIASELGVKLKGETDDDDDDDDSDDEDEDEVEQKPPARKGKIGSGRRPKPNDQQGSGRGGKPPKSSLNTGAEAYAKRHPKKE